MRQFDDQSARHANRSRGGNSPCIMRHIAAPRCQASPLLGDEGAACDEGSLPIRLSPIAATSGVLPFSRIKLGVGWCGDLAGDAE